MSGKGKHADFSSRLRSWQRSKGLSSPVSGTLEGPAGPSSGAAGLTVLTPLETWNVGGYRMRILARKLLCILTMGSREYTGGETAWP